MPIHRLSPQDTGLVAQFYREAPDYWLLAEGALDPDRQAREFFTDAPPGCDPAHGHRLGLFLPADSLSGDRGASPPPGGRARGGIRSANRLSGVAELSFGFPEPGEAFLGLMILGPWAQGAGHGRRLLAHAEGLARAHGAPRLFLAVLDANPRGRAFWLREGFRPTGIRRQDAVTGHGLERLVKDL
ncbi:GNAT family N-acetyltransferase [Tabrizicola sp.]|uniref:GNAT family N-acetyltransferase n=1 Tax=Tabrizicola sp. TaxID=2005166 RepID=UPI0035B05C5B